MKSNTTDYRFQVAHPDNGLIDAYPTRDEAFAAGDRWDQPERSGYPAYAVTVYDSMAKKRYPQIWQRCPLSPGERGRCSETGDKRTAAAYWKCIQRRGGPRLADVSRSLQYAERCAHRPAEGAAAIDGRTLCDLCGATYATRATAKA